MVAEAVGLRLEHRERRGVGLLRRGVGAARREGHRHLVAGVPGGLLDRRRAAEHDQVGERDLCAVGLGGIELPLHPLERIEHPREPLGLVHGPVFLRLKADPRPVGAAPLVAAAEGGGRGPGRLDEVGHRQAGGEDFRLERRDVGGIDERVIDRRHRILPQLRRRHLGAQKPGHRAHIAVGELVPGLGEGPLELFRVLVEPLGDRGVGRIQLQSEVRREHHRRVRLGVVVGVGHRALGRLVLRRPLPGAGRALRQLPLVTQEIVEVVVRPLGGRGAPGALQAAGDRVGPATRAEAVLPAEALLLERCCLGRGADVVGGAGAVRLAEGVAAGDQGHRLLVVHRHPREGLADVAGRGQRVGLAVRALWVHVDQAHLHGGQRVVELAIAGVPLVAEPLGLRPPIDIVLRLPDVGPAAAEAEGLEAHRLERHVSGQDHQVGPGDPPAILLLDRPEQPPGLVEVGVVGPAVERREPLRAVARAAPAIGHAVGAGRVPGHPDEERAVVAVVGRPPVLRAGHQRLEILLDRREIELLEGRRVVEVAAERVSGGRVLVEDLEVDLVGPPVAVGHAPGCRGPCLGGLMPDHGALRGRVFAPTGQGDEQGTGERAGEDTVVHGSFSWVGGF